MKFKFVLGIMILILATCSAKPQETNSGIEGQVFIGPTCPVMRIGQECPDDPYQAVLTVNSLGGERIVQVQTDEEGRFRIPLEAGEYILHPESPNTLPHAEEQTITVEKGKFTEVTVTYDSGIR